MRHIWHLASGTRLDDVMERLEAYDQRIPQVGVAGIVVTSWRLRPAPAS